MSEKDILISDLGSKIRSLETSLTKLSANQQHNLHMALQQQQQSLQQQRQQLTSQLQQQEEQHKHDIAALQEELHEQHTRSSTEALKCLSDNALKQLASLSLGDTALYYMPEKDPTLTTMAAVTHPPDQGLGFSIAGGHGNLHVLGDDGIFTTKVIPGGAAEEDATLAVGNRIMQDGQAGDSTPYVQRQVILDRPEGVGLGFNIIGGEGDTGIFISYISPGSFSDLSHLLKPGDQIIEVNGKGVQDASIENATSVLRGARNPVTLVVKRLADSTPLEPSPTGSPTKGAPAKQLYVQALFDYDSSKDDDRPSQGLSFKHGDILHIINSSDQEWWQAALVGNRADDGPQGLIPSKKRIEHRNHTDQKLSTTTEWEKDGKAEKEHIPTYKPVTLEPRVYARPLFILGPLKEDLNDMLVQEFPDKFAGCVPHTTRSPREGEVDGRDYHFVSSVEQMERDVHAHLFIEVGRYKGDLYGTSIKAVQEVATQGKHCILGVNGYAIRRLQMVDLYPIAICVRPASAEVIQSAQTRNSEDQCKQIFEMGQRIEQQFAEYFTAVVDGDSQNDIYTKVKNVIHEQSGNYIWVPSNEPL